MKAIINGIIVLKDKILKEYILIFSEKIENIIPKDEFDQNSVEEMIDAKGSFVCPGLIDLHIHGAGGMDTMDGTPEALETISRVVLKSGVTSFLPTTMTMSKEKIYKALENIRKSQNKMKDGANILGAHLEGPFINKKYKGAQNEKYIRKAHIEFIKDYLDIIKIITLAPEEDEEFKFIKDMKKYEHIVLSIGHTGADFETAKASFKEGIRHATHTFNAMTPLHHRKPGVIGAIFSTKMNCEIIADNIHVHPGFYQSFIDINGKENVILITDSMKAGSMEDGSYDLGGQKVVVKNHSARLEDGTLAGSILTMNKAIKNIKENTNLEIYEILNMASLNPAKLLGIEDIKGSIEVQKDADFFMMDKNCCILETYVSGDKKYC